MKAYKKTVIISHVKEEVKMKSGIILPDDKKIRYKLGKVVIWGDEVEGLEEGSEIYYDNMGESEMRVNGEKLYIISSNDIKVIL